MHQQVWVPNDVAWGQESPKCVRRSGPEPAGDSLHTCDLALMVSTAHHSIAMSLFFSLFHISLSLFLPLSLPLSLSLSACMHAQHSPSSAVQNRRSIWNAAFALHVVSKWPIISHEGKQWEFININKQFFALPPLAPKRTKQTWWIQLREGMWQGNYMKSGRWVEGRSSTHAERHPCVLRGHHQVAHLTHNECGL